MSEYWLGFPVACHYSQTHLNNQCQMLVWSLAVVNWLFKHSSTRGWTNSADELESNSEHGTYQQGILKKRKKVAVVTVSLLTVHCFLFSGLLTSVTFAEKTVSARATANVLKPYSLYPSEGTESTEASLSAIISVTLHPSHSSQVLKNVRLNLFLCLLL